MSSEHSKFFSSLADDLFNQEINYRGTGLSHEVKRNWYYSVSDCCRVRLFEKVQQVVDFPRIKANFFGETLNYGITVLNTSETSFLTSDRDD